MKPRHRERGRRLAAILGAVLLSVVHAQVPHVPPPLHGEALAFDAGRNRLVLVGGGVTADGGRTWSYTDETWEWDGRQWTIAVPAGSGPGPRSGHALGYDPEARRIVLYGGSRRGASGERPASLCDTWVYDGTRWTQVQATCVSTRLGANIVHDSSSRSLLLLEGAAPARDPRQPLRIWRWQQKDWVLVDSAGPRRAAGDVAVFDEARSTLVVPVFVGPDAGVWEWRAQRWERRSEGPLAGRETFALAYEPVRRRVILIGGEQSVGREIRLHNDAWEWSGGQWTALQVEGAPPKPRTYATLLADRAGGLLYFGGSERGPILRELWRLDRHGRWRLLTSPER